MRKQTKRIMIASLFFFILFTSQVLAGQFYVTWVYDGDTFKAEGNDIEFVVRFIAIDTPEFAFRKGKPDQPFASEAKNKLMDLILHKTVEIKGYGMDRYNRTLAVVYSSGKNIGVEMVRQGMAEIYQGKLPDNFNLKAYKLAELSSKTSRRGMWRQGKSYISPKEWRERERRR